MHGHSSSLSVSNLIRSSITGSDCLTRDMEATPWKLV
jgi:hypothetical protein